MAQLKIIGLQKTDFLHRYKIRSCADSGREVLRYLEFFDIKDNTIFDMLDVEDFSNDDIFVSLKLRKHTFILISNADMDTFDIITDIDLPEAYFDYFKP